jgi:hypothetical protein
MITEIDMFRPLMTKEKILTGEAVHEFVSSEPAEPEGRQIRAKKRHSSIKTVATCVRHFCRTK